MQKKKVGPNANGPVKGAKKSGGTKGQAKSVNKDQKFEIGRKVK